jgi:hypothetical protein
MDQRTLAQQFGNADQVVKGILSCQTTAFALFAAVMGAMSLLLLLLLWSKVAPALELDGARSGSFFAPAAA